ncbi:MAG: hypothetical protein EBU90_23345 [Proteobacteria bacterium]|nr:hypothetical protein [Pseudomonadota bacterium]
MAGRKLTDNQHQIVKEYVALARRISAYPSRSDLIRAGISRDRIRSHFGNMAELKAASKEFYPESFTKIIDTEIFNSSAFEDLKKKAKKHKVFVVTTVVAGAPVNQNLMQSIKQYCKKRNAMLLVIPADYALQQLDHDLVSDKDVNIVFKTLHLNSNICVNPIKIDPKQVDPATGLDSFGHSETVLIGSPKQRRLPVANSNNKMARIIQATGALTRPNYIPNDGIPKRRDTLAEKHHRMGGVIVEIVDDKLYHFRHFEMCKDGSFNDLFYNYSKGGVKFVGCLGIIQGDKHVGDTDPKVNAAVDEMCASGKPKFRVEHDFFNGKSINPHGEDDLIETAQLAEAGELNLRKEFQLCADELNRVRKLGTADIHVIVESNHNDWILRYLKKGKFSPENRLIATKLQALVIENGENPFKAAMEMMGVKMGPDLLFLNVDDDFVKAGIALGNHGHLGANGRKNPGTKGMYKAYGACFFGHGHHGEIYHDAMMVGTSTHLKLSYNKGASSWDNAQGILYKDGTRQLINVIHGKWRK